MTHILFPNLCNYWLCELGYGPPLNTGRGSVQQFQAPFVLENIGCAGNEDRLTDCPVEQGDYEDTYVQSYYETPQIRCEPFRQSFAFVACGADPTPDASGPGTTSPRGNLSQNREELFKLPQHPGHFLVNRT